MMKEKYFMEDSDDNAFSLIADFEGNEEQMFDVKTKSGDTLPVLPLRNMVLFPGVFMPVSVGRKSSLKIYIPLVPLVKLYVFWKCRIRLPL